MVAEALHSRSAGSITAADIRTRTALLPDTHTKPRPRIVETSTFTGPLVWRANPAGGFFAVVTVGNVACYWEGLDEETRRPVAWYYQQHNAAAQVNFSPPSIALACEWQLIGQFGGVQAPLDRQPFLPFTQNDTRSLQPVVASRSWVMPELISGRLVVDWAAERPPDPVTVTLQWSLIITAPIR
jgi:hypothetical protein